MDYETLVKSILRSISKDCENLDWYYIPPTEFFRRQPVLYSLFDSDGLPTHDADGNLLEQTTIEHLRKEWEYQQNLFHALEKLAMQYI